MNAEVNAEEVAGSEWERELYASIFIHDQKTRSVLLDCFLGIGADIFVKLLNMVFGMVKLFSGLINMLFSDDNNILNNLNRLAFETSALEFHECPILNLSAGTE